MNSSLNRMCNKNNELYIDNLVFAKVKGYPFWPAKIKNVDKESFKNVYKYGVNFLEKMKLPL